MHVVWQWERIPRILDSPVVQGKFSNEFWDLGYDVHRLLLLISTSGATTPSMTGAMLFPMMCFHDRLYDFHRNASIFGAAAHHLVRDCAESFPKFHLDDDQVGDVSCRLTRLLDHKTYRCNDLHSLGCLSRVLPCVAPLREVLLADFVGHRTGPFLVPRNWLS